MNVTNFKDLVGEHIQCGKSILCVTTNGYTKKNGQGVMGRGIAREVVNRINNKLPVYLGELLLTKGNKVNWLGPKEDRLVMFPVKYNWWEKADLTLIKSSAYQLVDFIENNSLGKHTIYLPKPGCGNGQLSWDTVEKAIDPILKDYSEIITIADFKRE